MMHRVFVQVVGFTSVERHALNTMFRLSQDKQSARQWSYEPWVPDYPETFGLCLIDGNHPDAAQALLDLNDTASVGVIWVGSISPARAWRSFARPLSWPAVLTSMDECMRSTLSPGSDTGGDTLPSVLDSTGAHLFGEGHSKRVLIADTDEGNRLYLRSKLAAMGLVSVDEASTVAQAKEHLDASGEEYDVLIVDLDLPGGGAWAILAQAPTARLRLAIQRGISFASRMSARVQGFQAMSKPLDPSRLNELLATVQP